MSLIRLFQGDVAPPLPPETPSKATPRGYAALPHRVTADHLLSNNAIRCLLTVFGKVGPSEFTDATDDEIARFYGCSRRSAARGVAELVERGYLRSDSGGGHRRLALTDLATQANVRVPGLALDAPDPDDFRVSDLAPASANPGTAECQGWHSAVPTLALFFEKEKENSETGPATSSVGGEGPTTTPDETKKEPPPSAAPLPRLQRGELAPSEEDLLTPELLELWEGFAAGGDPTFVAMSRLVFATHRRALAWVEAGGTLRPSDELRTPSRVFQKNTGPGVP
jgi:hypothetical protein